MTKSIVFTIIYLSIDRFLIKLKILSTFDSINHISGVLGFWGDRKSVV